MKRLRRLLAERKSLTLRQRSRREGRRWCVIGCRAAGWKPCDPWAVPSNMLPEAWRLCWSGAGLSWPGQQLGCMQLEAKEDGWAVASLPHWLGFGAEPSLRLGLINVAKCCGNRLGNRLRLKEVWHPAVQVSYDSAALLHGEGCVGVHPLLQPAVSRRRPASVAALGGWLVKASCLLCGNGMAVMGCDIQDARLCTAWLVNLSHKAVSPIVHYR